MLLAILLTLAFLGVLDKYTAPQKARWFYLHVWINAANLIVGFNDITSVICNPLQEYNAPWTSSNSYAVVAAGHLYHMFAFKNLKYMDWLHHITMIFITLPWTVYWMPNKGAVFAIAGLSGLPGGIDYVLCLLAKLEKISWNMEKKWNNVIQVWIRTPWLLFSCAWGWAFLMAGQAHCATAISFVFVFWNACFFMNDTLRSNYVKLAQKENIEKCV